MINNNNETIHGLNFVTNSTWFFLVFVKHKATFVRNIPPHLHHECDSWRHLAKLSWNDSDDTDVVSSHSSIFTSYVIYFNTVIIAIPVWMNVKF